MLVIVDVPCMKDAWYSWTMSYSNTAKRVLVRRAADQNKDADELVEELDADVDKGREITEEEQEQQPDVVGQSSQEATQDGSARVSNVGQSDPVPSAIDNSQVTRYRLHHRVVRVRSVAKDSRNKPFSMGYLVHPKHPVGWADAWPEAARHYTYNLPEYTGLGLYDRKSRYPDSHMDLFQGSIRSFTVQIMIAEGARLQAERFKLLHLKGWLLRDLNAALQDPRQLSSNTILSEVNALAIYDMLYDDRAASTAHLHGLRLLLQRYGGIARMSQESYNMSNMIRFTDGIHAYLTKTPRLLPPRTQGTDIADGIHPLRLALQPTCSDLSRARLESHLMMSYAAPVEVIFVVLAELHKLAAAVLGSTASLAPGAAIRTVLYLESRFGELSGRPNDLFPAIFSDSDRRNHKDTYNLIRLTALVLIQQFKLIMYGSSDATARAHLDHAIQKLLLHLLDAKVEIRSTEALCWAIFMSVPFLNRVDSLRVRVMKLLQKVFKTLQLHAWSDVRVFLTSIWFSAPLQEDACLKFWADMDEEALLDLPGS